MCCNLPYRYGIQLVITAHAKLSYRAMTNLLFISHNKYVGGDLHFVPYSTSWCTVVQRCPSLAPTFSPKDQILTLVHFYHSDPVSIRLQSYAIIT